VVKHFGPEDAHLTALRKEAELGRRYLAGLRREVVRLAMLSDDGLDGAMFAKMTRKLEEEELLELRRTYQARVDKRFPMEPQLKERPAAARDDETVFLV
jgi:hypothetical protein